jgi:hypothetical protein
VQFSLSLEQWLQIPTIRSLSKLNSSCAQIIDDGLGTMKCVMEYATVEPSDE